MRAARRLLVPALVALLLLPSPAEAVTAVTGELSGVASCSDSGIDVTAVHGPHFYVDLSVAKPLRGAYAGYRVTDTSGAARSDLWVTLTDFAGGAVALGAGQPASQQIATLPAGGSTSEFFYLTASAESATPQRHDVGIWQGRPDLAGSTQLCGTSGGFASVSGTIKAAANKLSSVSVSTAEPRIGSTFSITVKGSTGTIGSGTADDPQSFWMSPAALGDWPASAYRLEGTSLTFSDGSSYRNTLRVQGLPSPSQDYTAVYTFRAVGFTSAPAPVLPVQQIASGTQIKHTDLDAVATLPAIQPAVNDLLLSATATPTKLPSGGGRAHVVVTVTSSAGGALDSVEDTLAPGMSVVPGSVRWNGQPQADPALSGATAVFQGPLALGGRDVLEFDIDVAGSPGIQRDELVARVGAAQVDTTLDLTDHAPATTGVSVNAAPAAAADSTVVASGDAVTVDALDNDTDPDGDLLTITAGGEPTQGVVSTDGSRVTYRSHASATGTDTFDYTVSDGRGGTGTGTVEVRLAAFPPPSAADDTASVTAGEKVTVPVLANDDGVGLRVTQVTGPGATVSGDGDSVLYDAAGTAPGEHTVTYTITDDQGLTASATVVVTVVPAVVSPPDLVLTDDTAATVAGQPGDVPVLANDTGDGMELVAASATHGHAAVAAGDVVRYTPAEDFVGQDVVRYTVVDAHGRTAEAAVTVTVTEVPAPVDDVATVRWDGSVLVDILGNDPSGSRLAEVVRDPQHGEVVHEDGRLRYTPDGDYAGPDAFGYRLVGSSRTGDVSVTVGAPDLHARDDEASTTRVGGPVTVPVLANDTGTGLVVTSVGTPKHGAVARTDQGVRYTPDKDFVGEDTAVYTVRDVVGRTVTATVRFNVRNQKPTLAPFDPVVTTSGSALDVPVTAWDRDGDRLDVRLAGGADAAGPSVTGAATAGGSALRLRVPASLSGRISLPVSVRDGHGGETTRLLRLAVHPQPPKGLQAHVSGNADARALARPPFVSGRPVSRVLSERVDSVVTWRASRTTSVTSYEVHVNGRLACRTDGTTPGARQACSVRGKALGEKDRVTVVGVGGDGLRSHAVRVPVTTRGQGHLVAVVYFRTAESRLDRSAQRTLVLVARQAARAGYASVAVEGHTDAEHTRRSNSKLGLQRAREVRAFLRQRPGTLAVPAVGGYGESRPATTNRTRKGKAGNRRVELWVR